MNASFYRLPTVKAVQGWVEQTPGDFVFAVKMSRYVTHVKRLRELAPSLELYSRIEPLVLGASSAPCSGSCRRRSTATTTGSPRRSRSCPPAATPSSSGTRAGSRRGDDLLRAHGVALVIGDRPEIHAFQTHELTADWAFVRFHAGTRGRRVQLLETEPGTGPPGSAPGP